MRLAFAELIATKSAKTSLIDATDEEVLVLKASVSQLSC